LIAAIRARYALDWHGVHGVGHWARVRVNGLALAARTGANPQVVELFAFLHDTCRLDDGDDREHGWRAARFAASLVGTHILLPDRDVDLLLQACGGHTGGREHHSVTVLTCWDADRLDLGRVGVVPDPRRLCTAAACEPATLEAAYRRSLARPRRMQKIARGASAFLKADRR
jgi:uncharacterized protein